MKNLKKIGLIAVVLCLSTILVACGGSKDLKITSTITERVIPEADSGYVERTVGAVSMYLPGSWTPYEFLGVSMYMSGAMGSSSSVNVITVNEASNLKKAKKSDYEKELKAVGTNVNITEFKLVDFCGDHLLYIKLTMTQLTLSIHMWQFVVSKNDATHIITVTIAPGHDIAIADVIYKSLLFS